MTPDEPSSPSPATGETLPGAAQRIRRSTRAPLGPLHRALALGLTWGLIGLAQPGVLRPDGFGHLAFFAVGPWAFAAARPGRFAFLIEWVMHSLGLACVFAWMIAFLPAILAPMSIVPALYPAFAGILLRRTARWPLALLAPAAWMLAEVVRWTLPVPLSFGWFRLGMLMHDTEWLVGSAAWFGTWGLTWALAALGGLAADLFLAVRRPAGASYPLIPALACGLGPLIGAIVLSAQNAPPSMRSGPDVLIVQPGISQEIKAARRDPIRDRFVPQVSATLRAIYETRGADAAHPDVVLWGETFLPGKLASPTVERAFEDGARPADWAWPYSAPMTRQWLADQNYGARDLVAALFGKATGRAMWQKLFQDDGVEWADRVLAQERLLPPGTSFLSGVEAWTVVGEGESQELRSWNAVGLWDADGTLGDVAPKVHVVPGGETGDPLRGIPFVLDVVRSVAKAIPDFVGAEEPTVLPIRTRSAGTVRAAIAVCFDNAFDDPFTAPLRRGPVDLFVVASNEAWYDDSPLMDHMLAFTRIAAVASQRSIVRATNSGVSCLVGPDGTVLEQLTVDGRRKMVAGVLRGVVPVPEEAVAPVTFFVRSEPWQPLAWGGGSALVLLLAILVGRLGGSGGGSGGGSEGGPIGGPAVADADLP